MYFSLLHYTLVFYFNEQKVNFIHQIAQIALRFSDNDFSNENPILLVLLL
jgi:hypothetical protein